MRRPAVEAKLRQLTADLEAAANAKDLIKLHKVAQVAREELLRQPPPNAHIAADPLLARLLKALDTAEEFVVTAQSSGRRTEALKVFYCLYEPYYIAANEQ